jgi:hypothetical protein
MTEFCAGVKILLERMKSNPEDFEVLDFNAATYKSIEGRFLDFARALAKVISCDDDKDIPWQEWRYFTEEERQALVAGFTEMKRAKFDKEIMERVFDDQYIERQREEHQYTVQLQTHQLNQLQSAQAAHVAKARAAQAQAVALAAPYSSISAQQGGTGFTGGGLMNSLGAGLGGIFK